MEIRKFARICLTCISVLCLSGCTNTDKLQSEGIALSSQYLELEKGVTEFDLTSYKYIDGEKVKICFDARLKQLEGLNNNYIDVDEFYNTYYVGLGVDDEYSSSYASDDSSDNYYNPKLDPNNVGDILVDDNRIIEKEGKKVVMVRDLNLSGSKSDIVNYKGVAMPITYNEVTETYGMMQKNPKYNYKYVNHNYNKEKKCIDIKYTSIIDSEYSKIVRVSVQKGKIVNIGLREN